MFEGLVKRLLDTYLAPYVDGITQNLQLAVWSGNIVLENLTLKTDITEKLALPFDVHFGKIGRLSLTIPWASLGATPVKVLVDSIYVCIGGIERNKTDEELRSYVRLAKEKLIGVLENEYSAFLNSLNQRGNSTSSYLIRLSQKVLNNIQIDFTNIHLHCSDTQHAFGFIIDSISVRKFRKEDGKDVLKVDTSDTVKEERVTHVCSLLGFSIYERATKDSDGAEESDAESSRRDRAVEGAAGTVDSCENDVDDDYKRFDTPFEADPAGGSADTESPSVDDVQQPTGDAQGIASPSQTQRAETMLQKFSTGKLDCNFLLDKLSFRLFLAINVKNKSIFASLSVGAQDSSDGADSSVPDSLRVVLSVESLRAFVAMWNDFVSEHERSERLLMEKAYTVDQTPEGMKGITRTEYITLYAKKLNALHSGGEQLSPLEEERLAILTDVVSARHLARWRFAAHKLTAGAAAADSANKAPAKESSEPGPTSPAATTTTWFGWLRGLSSSSKKQTTATPNAVEDTPPGADAQGAQASDEPPTDAGGDTNDVIVAGDVPAIAEGGLQRSISSDSENPPVSARDTMNPGDVMLSDAPNEHRDGAPVFVDSTSTELPSSAMYPEYVEGAAVKGADQVECLPGGLVLTGEEVEQLMDAMALGEMFEDSMATSNYYFECALPHFDFVVDVGGLTGSPNDSLSVSTGNLQLQVYLNAAVDTSDRDTYNAYLYVNLDSFDVRYKNKVIMAFIKSEDVSSTDEEADVYDAQYEPAPVADSFAIDLRVVHKVTNQGNLLMVTGELKPMETHLIPVVISEFIEMLVYIQPNATRRTTYTIPPSVVDACKTPGAALDNISMVSSVDDEMWAAERNAARMAVDHLPALFAFDIKFAAPILMLYNGEGDRMNVRFGTLNLKSNGPCPLSNMSGTIELKETQVSCLRKNSGQTQWYNFLRPLPVKIHYDCDLVAHNLNVDIIFEELFMQSTPLDTAVVSCVLAEIAACLMGARASLRRDREVKPAVEVEPTKKTFDKIPFNLKAMIIFRHSGFSVSNTDGCDVFRLEVHNVSLELELSRSSFRAVLGLERVMVSNPAMDMPLFFTHLDTMPVGRSAWFNEDDDNEFEDALEETAKSLQVEVTRNESCQYRINATITEMEGNWQHSSVKLIIDTIEDYKQLYMAKVLNEHDKTQEADLPAEDAGSMTIGVASGSETSTPILKAVDASGGNAEKVGFATTQLLSDERASSSSVGEEMSSVASDTEAMYRFNSALIRGETVAYPTDGYVWREVEDCNIDLKELPTLLSEEERHEHKALITVSIKGAAVVFWNADSQVEARLSVSGIGYKLLKYGNGESISNLEIRTGKLTYGGRCLLSYTDTKTLEEGSNTDEPPTADKPLMTLRWKMYDSAKLGVPYSMCMRGALERIVFVYFQQDIVRLMDYLDDGILSVFISRSYHKVVQVAASTHMFYSFSVASPCFLIPENKAILPTASKDHVAPGSTLPNNVTRSSAARICVPIDTGDEFCAQMAKRLSGIVDTWYFGSYLLFELGHLYFRNGYTQRDDISRKSTIYLKMLGTRASIIEQTDGSTDVMGKVLQSTDLAVCYIGGGMLELGIDSDAWILKLTRTQLSFIIDVFNENICGSSYKTRSHVNVSSSAKPPFRCGIRLSLNRFEFDTLFSPEKPLASLKFDGITVCLNFGVDTVRMTSCYQFGLCGKTLTVDDERPNSVNVHRRLINCFVHDGDAACADLDDDARAMEPSVTRLLHNWLRQYKNSTGHDFFSNASSADIYGIKVVVVNENNQTGVDCMVANADISLLCIHAMDLLRYFTLSYSSSSMALCPKQSHSTQTVSNAKIYTFNFKATNGKFIAFTRMDSTSYPQLELSTDFFLEMTMQNGSFNFLKVDVLGCKLERVYPVTAKRQVLCSCLEVYGSGQYVSQPQGYKMFFNFTIPPSNLTLYTKDLSVILAAVTAVLTDGPSAAPPRDESDTAGDGAGTPGRFLSVSFNIKGIKVTFFDDMRKCLIPMMRLSVASENIEYMSLPIEKRYTVVRCSTRLEYFNAIIGDWEPCLERCNCSLEYTNNIGTDRNRRRQGRVLRPGSEDEWKDFIPNKVLKISSAHNILINITPSLCQLLLWFIPMLTNNIQRGLVYTDTVEEEADPQVENSAYRYVNLTGHDYYVFALQSTGDSTGGIKGLRVVEKSCVPQELDSVVSFVSTDNSSSACIYVIACPPPAQVTEICNELGIENREPIARDLMVTRNAAKTRANMVHSKSYLPSSYAVPFENGTVAAMVPLARNCCVSLKCPIEDLAGTYNKNTLICEVKSPHPSHKLLMFTSTVRVYNRSGMPLLLCFLDQKMNVMSVSSLKTRGAPISILDKGGPAGDEFGETTTVHFPESNVNYLRLQQEEVGYTMLLEHNHFGSVPECVFQGPAHAVMSFLPAPLAMNRPFMEAFFDRAKRQDASRTEAWMKLSNTSGWSKLIDSSRHLGTRVRQCYCPGFTKSSFLYYVVSVVKRKSAFPANVEMRDIVIYPALSVMNTLPMEIDVCFGANDRVTEDNASSSKKAGNYIEESLTLLRESITHIYSLPPNESLSFMAKICYSGSNVWSDRVTKIYGTSETHTMLNLPIKGMAPVEVELIRYPGGLPASSTSFQGHLSLIINAPWWFIDRTGLGISFQKRLPRAVMRGLSFLSSENQDDTLHLCVNRKAIDKVESNVRMPAVGGYAYTIVESGGKRHSVCLVTEKISISGLSNHVTCRITSAIPSFVFINNLKTPISIRKDSRTPHIVVEPGQNVAVPWVLSKTVADPASVVSNVAPIEFKTSDEAQWSSPIIPSESHSGKTYMCVKQDKSNKPLVFCISVVPKGGTKYCSIAYPQCNNEGFVLCNQCPYIKAAMVRTFHQGGDSGSKGNGVYFTAKYGQTVHFGWQQPFLNKTRLCQVMLWLDKNTVAPIKPLVINIGSPAFRYRQVEVTTPEYASNHAVLVSAENRGDYIAIDIKPSGQYLEVARTLNTHRSENTASTSSQPESGSLSRSRNSENGDNTPDHRHAGDPRGPLDLDTEILKNSEGILESNESEYDVGTDTRSMQIQVQLSQIGLSLVSHNLHEELFFLEMSTVSFVSLFNGDHQRLELRISDIQIDNQAEEKHADEDQCSTILVNRRKTSGQEHQRHFLQIYVDRPFASCKDLCLKKVFIALDDLEVDISDVLLTRVYNFYKECMKCMGNWGPQEKIDLRTIDSWVQKESQEKLSSLEKNPVPPRTLVLDFLFIERFNLVLWCSFDLEKLHMLGDLMRVGLRIICVSRHFELMGAPLQFQQENFCNSRGSIRSFYEEIKDKYVHAALSCIGSLLGYSSLLNIPKIPINVGRNTLEFAAEAVDSVSSGIGSLLSKFTFDNEYINKRQRDRMNKPSGNMRDSIVSAGKSIGEGFMSLTNIVTKPIEGAQKGGMGGFIRGLGKGLAGSIVKPIDKVGQAVSHVSRTIKVNMSRQLDGQRWSAEPCRWPRMLWGEYSQLKPYSLSDAEIKQQLGHKFSKHIVHCETVSKHSHPPSHIALLFYPSKVYYVDLKPKPTILWKASIADIQECRASCYGVIIRVSDTTLQVPCTNAGIVYSIFVALQNAKRQSKSSIVIGPELFESYK
ncbi:VACUOLAR PROTEIN SORTING-ASSOCIATED PROTEIN domain containing protein, putative [Babesia bigemina]|uniref:VACUOLAR PROTEIN SORTING-ASSOCIATED PROTEIN domain containing protein, putative n=1 Tax=Babesia bigemina TaxID=5866 RepID=A0A061DDN2_BABBI|nr:VACUOLAR PROTEIN SORTING-ASSOCIATED PROTEIN domain containing protein, putative [Babesia bigemina]CDR96405.1 VACUOLAR PROTEIN SORTING-ASSOCIATED PROTEIN domain containing protein, putative [Babesia bigemina]|eukprot:XP_012768591.1 VACUOLAR PROTEIN SORTING-ASSOCIATED PROTEIN domain containing protein, putative [Babesia bigemina]